MRRHLLLIVALFALAAPNAHGKSGSARVQRSQTARKAKARKAKVRRPERPRRPALSAIQKLINPWKKLNDKQRSFIDRFMGKRLKWIRARGTMFNRITQKRDYSRDHVIMRNKKVTAFLDWSDPQHPQFDPSRHTGEQHLLDAIPAARRAHVLVIPNQPREHIAQTLGAQITLKDVDAARSTLKEAHAVAKRLGIVNPRIWINSPDRISVGYLHVHIIGERTKGYPAPLPGAK